MSSRACATEHIKDPVPLIEKRRGLSPGGRFPPSFIHQVIIITGLNKLYVLALKMVLQTCPAYLCYKGYVCGYYVMCVHESVCCVGVCRMCVFVGVWCV